MAVGAIDRIFELEREVAGLADSFSPDSHSGPECADAEQRLFRIQQRLDAVRLLALRRVDSSGEWQAQRCESTIGWLKNTRHIDHGRAKADVLAARATAELPSLTASLADGSVSRAHLDAVARVGMATPERQAVLAEFDHVFDQVARRCVPGQLSRVMTSWADQLQPEITAKDEGAAHRRRCLYLLPLRDGWDIRGFLGHEQGTALQSVLNAELERDFRDRAGAGRDFGATGGDRAASNGEDQAQARAGDPAVVVAVRSAADDALRPIAQRRADALLRIAGIAAATGQLPETGDLPPVLTVTVPMDRLSARGSSGQVPAPRGGCGPAGLPYLNGSAQVGVPNGYGHAILSERAAQRLACDSRVQRVLLDPAGLPLDVGRSTRTIPHHLRRALVLRDGGCIYPGCAKPPGWCQGHHVIHWADGGPTSLGNLALLCDHHHRVVHEAGLTIEFRAGRPRVRQDGSGGARHPVSGDHLPGSDVNDCPHPGDGGDHLGYVLGAACGSLPDPNTSGLVAEPAGIETGLTRQPQGASP